MPDSLETVLADLTGQDISFRQSLAALSAATDELFGGDGMGCSQLNELLLFLGYDRLSREFFQFLLDGTAEYKPGAAFNDLSQLRNGVDRFRQIAILRFGNVKYAFKYLSAPSTNLADELGIHLPVDESEFERRHGPLIPIKTIPGNETYYLGYLIKRQLEARLQSNPDDEDARAQLAARESIVAQGKANHEAYLASDHMDVYVATSMRERHEYQFVSQIVQAVFTSDDMQRLKVRWFDPTQAYCEDRIDKGLAEALMLKRAACTLYLAQESDTLGKDSELASTLAQGKPVIAFIPSVIAAEQSQYVDNLLQTVSLGSPGIHESGLVLQQLRVFKPDAAWTDSRVKGWVNDPATMDLSDAKQLLGDSIRKHYDGRAQTLKESHPLGIQVHLETGVANGVIVARTTADCATLIRRILTRTLEFDLVEQTIASTQYLLLKEKITQSVFRVVTGDRFLTNAFWNFYLPK